MFAQPLAGDLDQVHILLPRVRKLGPEPPALFLCLLARVVRKSYIDGWIISQGGAVMLLMDDLAATAALVMSGAARDGERSPSLGIFLDLDRRMRLCPRFLLDEHVVRSAID